MSNREYNFFNTVEGSQTKQESNEMANQEHLAVLKQGVKVWNRWREKHADIKPDLSRADLGDANLERANLSQANLSQANLSGADLNSANLDNAYLIQANLSQANSIRVNLGLANLNQANLSGANLSFANLSFANLGGADLGKANLERANLSKANLSGADLSRTFLVGTNLANTILKDCSIYGIAAWDVQLDGAVQLNLTITPEDQPIITVDNLKIAQFIYLLLNNKEIRDVINTLTTKSVLILGRFTPERKAALDALREALRQHNYLPILFDFEKPASRDITETISTLAHLARFIIADLTDPSSIPQELQAIVPTLAVPVQPVLLEGKREYSMFSDFLKTYHWVLPVYYYRDQGNLLATLKEQVIEPAEQKAKELEKR